MKTEMQKLPVQSMNDLALVGTMLEKSAMFGLKTEGSGMVVAMTCYQQGITPLEFIRTYHIIDNKPAMRADAMAAAFRKAGGTYKGLIRSDEEAKAQFVIKEEKVDISMKCTMDSIKKQGICYKKDGKTLKDNWQKFPENMLWARMMSNAVRILMPEIVAGIYTPEEIQDFDDASVKEEIPVTPKKADAVVKKATAAQKKEQAAKEVPTPIEKAVKDAEVTVDVKAEEVKPEPSPEPTIDFSLCPMNPKLGVPFKDLTTEDLNALKVLENPKILNGHREAIGMELDARSKTTYE